MELKDEETGTRRRAVPVDRGAPNERPDQAAQARLPRVLLVSFSVCPAPDRHGVELLNVVKALSSRYELDVLTLKAGDLPFVERRGTTRMLRVPVGGGALPEQVDAFRRAIGRQLEGEEYDVVHLRSAWGGRAVFADSSLKVVYEVARATEGEPRAADAELAARLAEEERLCVAQAQLVLVPTEAARRHVETSAPAGRAGGARLVRVVRPGVDVDHFDWEPPLPPRLGEGAVERVMYVGQLGAGRGIRLLLLAMGLLRRRRPQVRLILAGPVDEGFGAVIEATIVKEGLVGAVDRLGAVEHGEVPRLLAQADVCVAPAAPDEAERPLATFPTKLLEYMACRRVVVAPRRLVVTEVLRDGEDALLFEPGEGESLAHQLDRLLGDRALAVRLSERAYQRVRAEHPASATRRELLAAYATILPQQPWHPSTHTPQPVNGLPTHQDTTSMRRVAERLGQVSSPVAAAVALVPDAVLQGAAAVEPPDDDDDDDDDVVIEIVYPTAGPGDGAGGTAPEASLRDDAEQARVERE